MKFYFFMVNMPCTVARSNMMYRVVVCLFIVIAPPTAQGLLSGTNCETYFPLFFSQTIGMPDQEKQAFALALASSFSLNNGKNTQSNQNRKKYLFLKMWVFFHIYFILFFYYITVTV